MKLSALQQQTATLEVPFAGETITLTYKSGAYTPAYMAGMGQLDLTEHVAGLVTSWDLTDESDPENPVPYPVTPEALAALPTLFLRAIAEAISEDQGPNRKRPTGSGFTS